MPSKYLVLVLFALWSLISWRWYVCVIKEHCSPETAAAEITVSQDGIEGLEQTTTETAAPGNEKPETAETAPPVLPAPAPPTLPSPPGNISTPPDNLDRVQIVEFNNKVLIHFPYISSRREENAAIDEYLNRLAQNLVASGRSITITGHTDMVGDAKANKAMGLQRAQHIRDILVKKGVPKQQINCRSMGESKPIATNDTPQGRYQNRRVEIQ